MRSVVTSGTGMNADPGKIAAGKTGTTNNYRDAWFVGYTPRLTTAIWVGYDKMGLSLGIGQAGGGVAAPIWGRYMKKILEGTPNLGFPTYAHLIDQEVCAKSGLLPGPNCKRTYHEQFIKGRVPTKECDVCKEGSSTFNSVRKGPKENISGSNRRQILRSFKEKDDDEDDIIDDSENELLNR